jgi:hypothetical protein
MTTPTLTERLRAAERCWVLTNNTIHERALYDEAADRIEVLEKDIADTMDRLARVTNSNREQQQAAQEWADKYKSLQQKLALACAERDSNAKLAFDWAAKAGKFEAEAANARAQVERLTNAAKTCAHNLGSLKMHYLQHIRLDDVKPADLASQLGYERDQLEAALTSTAPSADPAIDAARRALDAQPLASAEVERIGERIALNAAMLRLFKGNYRDSGDRHSDALFVKDGLEVGQAELDLLRAALAQARKAGELDKARLDWLEKQAAPWADHEGKVPGGAMRSIEFDWFAEETMRQGLDAEMERERQAHAPAPAGGKP